MSFIFRPICFNGRLNLGMNTAKLQIMFRRQFGSGSSSLRETVRERVDQVRSEVESRIPLNRIPTGSLDSKRMIILGGAALGLGGLCLYGLYGAGGGSKYFSMFDKSGTWPDYVRKRVQSTYAYLTAGVTVTTASAIALTRSRDFSRVVFKSRVLTPLIMAVVTIGSGVICQMIPYPLDGSKLNKKHATWLLYAVSLGGVVAPICLLGGPIVTRAAVYAAGIVGSLSAVAVSAPSDRFLRWGGPLAIGLGVVFVSSLGSMFLSPMGRLGAGLNSIGLYGGLLLFSGLLLHNSKVAIRRAEQHPNTGHAIYSAGPGTVMAIRPFDPINNSMKVLLDVFNIYAWLGILRGRSTKEK